MENKELAEVKTLSNKIFEALGEVSMCWSETPKGVFDSTKAKEIGDRLIEEIKNDVGKFYMIDTNYLPDNFDLDKFLEVMKDSKLQPIYRSEPALQEAIKVLQKHLREDKSEGSYYHSWMCNIKMSMFDSVSNCTVNDFETGTDEKELLEACEKAAKNFLDLLIKE